jgi:hypothetical protein
VRTAGYYTAPLRRAQIEGSTELALGEAIIDDQDEPM